MRYTDTHAGDLDSDPDVDALAEALAEDNRPDREVIPPRSDRSGRWMPTFRVWMRDGYTLLTHAHTAGEACGNAIEDARGMIQRIGLDRRMSNREKRLATTVDCWQQIV